jgi:hypothetical protein
LPLKSFPVLVAIGQRAEFPALFELAVLAVIAAPISAGTQEKIRHFRETPKIGP